MCYNCIEKLTLTWAQLLDISVRYLIGSASEEMLAATDTSSRKLLPKLVTFNMQAIAVENKVVFAFVEANILKLFLLY